MVTSDDVKLSAEKLSAKFKNNIDWYRGRAARNRILHYCTLFGLIVLTTAAPALTAIATLLSVDTTTKVVAIVVSCAAAIVAAIRGVCQFETTWGEFYMALLFIEKKKDDYESQRARLPDDPNKQLNLIDDVRKDLDEFVRKEAKRYFANSVRASKEAEKKIATKGPDVPDHHDD